MADNGIQTTLPPPAAPPSSLNTPSAPDAASPRKAKKRDFVWYAWKALSVLASLRLTVVLLALSMVLVFCITVAQVDQTIWGVVEKYFRTFFVWIPFQIFFHRTFRVGGGFPFPGGYTIGTLLLVNLLAAHLVRFKLSWKRSGVLMIHAGLIIMMVGELTTRELAVEGMMSIREGQTSNYVEHPTSCELAVIDRSNPAVDDVAVIPASLLRKGGMISSPDLPFDVVNVVYMPNATIHDGGTGPANLTDLRGSARTSSVEEKPEASGTSMDQKYDLPAAYVTLRSRKSGEALGTWLMSILLDPQPIEVDGKTYMVGLRFGRTYKPYSLTLIEGRHDTYQGTQIPRNYSSKLRLVDKETGENREVLISMNDPLRYRGEAFYQSNMSTEAGTGVHTTGLQVVKNPGWLMPYFSCVIVGLGMLIHFGINLVTFLERRAAS